jgi:hypothetical protein
MMAVARRNLGETYSIRVICSVAVLGVVAITLAILRATGVMPREQRERPDSARPLPGIVPPISRATAEAPAIPRGNDSSISPRPLELLLVRTRPGRTPHEGSAQIGVVQESPQTYLAGALLENGARLMEIHSDYVVLQKDGGAARLYLSGQRVAGRSSDAALLTVGGAKQAITPAPITSREVLTDYLRPNPVYEGESLLGYEVYSGAKAGPFTQLGLRPGDLITTVGGTPLTDVSTAWDMLRELMDGAVLPAVVKRHGETLTLTLDGSILLRAEEARALNTGLPMMTSTPYGAPAR